MSRRRLIILEGPDGGGKTTLGKELSAKLGVQVTNHGPYKGEQQIWKHYFDSMLPAYSGERDVILDRCWLAEPVYGEVYRGGMNRLESWQTRILEYVASECMTRLIFCLPPVESCLNAFRSRRDEEMLENEEQLRMVYRLYEQMAFHNHPGIWKIGPSQPYDYTITASRRRLEEVLNGLT